MLEGSVLWNQPTIDRGRVRITAQLIRAADDTHLWAEGFDRELTDLFAVQSEIAVRVVRELRSTLLAAERAAVESRPTDNLDAYRAYLRGRFYSSRPDLSEEASVMTLIRITAALFILAMPTTSFAQEWIEYVDRTERFCVNFPGQPTVRDITYQPQNGKPVPARVYAVQDGARRYSVTVVNYTGRGNSRGAIAWEAWNFRKRGGEVTYDAFSNVDRIEGHQLHITNKDKSQTVAGIYLHDRRLYVLEATVPPNSPGAVHFQQSLYMLDQEGKRVRYELDAEGNRTGRVQYPDRACS